MINCLFKKTLSLATAIIICILSCTAPSFMTTEAEAASKLMGDIDMDEEVSSKDALYILKSVVGLASYNDEQKSLGDVYPDGVLNATDSLHILKYITRIIDSLDNLCAHDWRLIEEQPSTCTTSGYQRLKCKKCEEEMIRQLLPAEHNYSDKGVCQVCGKADSVKVYEALKQEIINKKQYDEYGNPYYSEGGDFNNGYSEATVMYLKNENKIRLIAYSNLYIDGKKGNYYIERMDYKPGEAVTLEFQFSSDNDGYLYMYGYTRPSLPMKKEDNLTMYFDESSLANYAKDELADFGATLVNLGLNLWDLVLTGQGYSLQNLGITDFNVLEE